MEKNKNSFWESLGTFVMVLLWMAVIWYIVSEVYNGIKNMIVNEQWGKLLMYVAIFVTLYIMFN